MNILINSNYFTIIFLKNIRRLILVYLYQSTNLQKKTPYLFLTFKCLNTKVTFILRILSQHYQINLYIYDTNIKYTKRIILVQ